ncbi:MAG: sugar transferase [Lachnospiraceae bacterium]|nr:sugar transferase [Lachnospiraceae bacterium]
MKKWEELPDFLRLPEVRPYYDALMYKRAELLIKRLLDVFLASILIIILSIPMVLIAVLIKMDSPGPIFYRQERVTTYGKCFRIHKFRTMVNHADQLGSTVTIQNDVRITKIGEKLRGLRLDELPQLIDVLQGNMSFVGTRPESIKYVKAYEPVYRATLLLPAGITSEASIRFKDEATLLENVENADSVYLTKVLPIKMKYNLDAVKHFSLVRDMITMVKTVFAVLGKDYSDGES